MASKVITVTEIGVFKRCRRMWSYQYQHELTPLREAPYFFIGRMVHQALAEWTQTPDRPIQEIWAQILQQELDFYEARYIEVVGAKPSKLEKEEMMANALMPYHMVMNYVQHWQQPLPDNFELIQPEQTCLVKVPGLTGVELEATLDGLVVNRKSEKLFVLERKTYEQRPRIETLESYEQFVGYCWVIRQLFPEYELGGVLYDGMWKRETPPRGKKFEDLFFRHLLLKDEAEIADFESNLIKVAAEMTGAPAIYPNRVWRGCWDDQSFERLCLAESKGYDFEDIKETYYGKREKAHWKYGEEDE